MIERSETNGITTLRLAHGKASAIDVELFEALETTLREVAKSDTRALILTGTGSIFSAGVDLFRVVDGGADYVARFYPLLDRVLQFLFDFPKPVVAAANGHAIAGGAILVFCADYRLMADGNGRIGVPELLVGVPFPPAVLEIVRFAAPSAFQQLVYTGATLLPKDALAKGLVDELVEREQLEARAMAVAEQLASLPPNAFQSTKQQLRRPPIDAAKQFDGGSERAMWMMPETHEHIRAYLAKTIKK